MKKKSVWLVLSCLMVAALLLASCGPAEEEEEEEVVTPAEEEVVTEEEVVEEEGEMVKLVLEKLDGTVIEKLVEKPKYGGRLTLALGEDVRGFDSAYEGHWMTHTLNLTNEGMTRGDWARGPAGTGEASWLIHGTNFIGIGLEVGTTAESWEMPDEETIIYHIRQGVHFHDKPPVNGREMNADDVVFSMKRVYEIPGSYLGITYPEGDRPWSITAPDKWTVVLKCPPHNIGPLLHSTSGNIPILPPEMVEKWGDVQDWRTSCGTGPFELVDYVPMSSVTFERFPNYWGTDPLHPENHLPYLDDMKWLVIPDNSTRISALRTGKIDRAGVGWEDAGDLMKTNPDLKYIRHLSTISWNLHMRIDKPELPFADIRVRRALAMAINNKEIKDYLYEGNAEVLTHPAMPVTEFMDMYVPLEELPESTREMYEYHPDKAKQLLVEAGYPDGFKTKVLCPAGSADTLSLVKDYWEEIGVELELQVREVPVWYSMGYRRQYDEIIFHYQPNDNVFKFGAFRPGNPLNLSFIDDQRCIETYQKVTENIGWDDAKVRQILREIYPYVLDQCWSIQLPTSYGYVMWWPWVKAYHGESSVGYFHDYNYPIWIWIDQELRKEMGY